MRGLSPYTATLNSSLATSTAPFPGNANILGISFYLQNSVMHDLSDNVIGYTPFFVTDRQSLATTAGGPLIVSGASVPLGLAGVVSGPGRGSRSCRPAARCQLSATNTYSRRHRRSRPARPAADRGAGQHRPVSSGVSPTTALFDISRAWAPVAVQALSGSGLGEPGRPEPHHHQRQRDLLGHAGRRRLRIPACGGSLTLAGGAPDASAGTGSYTGGTAVSGGHVSTSPARSTRQTSASCRRRAASRPRAAPAWPPTPSCPTPAPSSRRAARR